MNAAAADTLHPLVRKLESIAPLADEERHAIVGLPMMPRNLKADQDIVRDQERPSQCRLILEGFACRYKVIEGGKRQIFSFHIPGDIPDLQSIHLDIMDHSLATIVASRWRSSRTRRCGPSSARRNLSGSCALARVQGASKARVQSARPKRASKARVQSARPKRGRPKRASK